jgi:thiamine transport system permease protein
MLTELSKQVWRARRWQSVALMVPLVFLAVFFFYPLFEILRVSLAPNGRLDLAPIAGLLRQSYYGRVLWFTTWQATVSTLLTLALGLPAAYVFARYTFPGKTVLRALSTVPFVMPTVVVAAAFSALLGPNGEVNRLLMHAFHLSQPPVQIQQTIWMILVVHVFYNATIVLRMVGGFWANVDPRLEQAAAVLGASRGRVFREITLPLLLPSLTAASLLIFLFCFTSFGVILILGGPRFATLEVEIYRQAVNLFHLPVAAALALVQMAITLAVMMVYTRVQARITTAINFKPQQATQRRMTGWRQFVVVGLGISLLFGLLLAPLAALVVRSVSTPTGVSLIYFQELFNNRRQSILFVPPVEALRNSLLFACAALALALILGVLSAYLLARPRQRATAWLDPLFMLPLGASSVTLGLGFLVALDSPPLNLRASPLLIPLAHTLVALPFVIRSLLPVLRGIHPHLREAAGVLGAAPHRVRREVDLPILAPALIVGAVFAFTVSLGEFGATVLIARPQTPTLPLAIYRFLGQPGALNYGQALAASSLLMLVCAVGFILLERMRYGETGEF